jgi:amino acid transporter
MGMNVRFKDKEKKRPEINPIWRGIGFILLIVVPLVTFALTAIAVPPLLATGYVPNQLVGHINFPAWVARVPVLRDIAHFIWSFNNLGLGILVFIAILVLLTGIFSLIYVAILQYIGPPRYTETDAPPSKHKGKVYKR